MSHVGEAPELPLQAQNLGGPRVQQGLEGDVLVPRQVVHLVDDAHAADAELPPHGKPLCAGELFRGFASVFGEALDRRVLGTDEAGGPLVRPHEPLDLGGQRGVAAAGLLEPGPPLHGRALHRAVKKFVQAPPPPGVHN